MAKTEAEDAMGVRKRKTIYISITLHRLQRTFMNAISSTLLTIPLGWPTMC